MNSKIASILLLFISFAGCYPLNCPVDQSTEAKKVVAMSQDDIFEYPADFYVDVSPLAGVSHPYYHYLTPCAGNLSEAGIIFDNANSIRNYTLSSSHESDYYYERAWQDSSSADYLEIVFKNNLIDWDNLNENFFLKTINNANAKTFSELWFQLFSLYGIMTDIYSSAVSEDTAYFVSTIKNIQYMEAPGSCTAAVIFQRQVQINKNTGVIEFIPYSPTPVISYNTGEKRPHISP